MDMTYLNRVKNNLLKRSPQEFPQLIMNNFPMLVQTEIRNNT